MADPRTQDIELTELLSIASEAWFQKYHAPIPGQINSYSTSPARVDVKPIVPIQVEGVETDEIPILRDVPVCFPGGGLTAHTWPLVPGQDVVSLVPQDVDISAFAASGAVFQRPKSTRRFALSDALAFPLALRPGGSPLPPAAFASDGAVLYGLTYAGGSDATDFAAMAAKVLDRLQDLTTAFNLHKHTGVTTGGGTSAVSDTLAPDPPDSVACTKLKVK